MCASSSRARSSNLTVVSAVEPSTVRKKMKDKAFARGRAQDGCHGSGGARYTFDEHVESSRCTEADCRGARVEPMTGGATSDPFDAPHPRPSPAILAEAAR